MKDSYTLFVTPFLKHPGQKGQTGGTLSNYFVLEYLRNRGKLKILSFDPDEAGARAYKEQGFDVDSRPTPGWGGVGLLANWVGFVRQQLKDVIRQHGMPADILLTTSTLPAICVRLIPDDVRVGLIVQAYENFGFSPPGGSWRFRLSLAKAALIRRFSDRSAFKRADYILTNSRFMRKAICHRFSVSADKVHIVPQICDTELPKIAASEVAGVVGFVSRGSEKNLDLVIELAGAGKKFHFLIYGHLEPGDVPEMPNLEVRGWCADRNQMLESAAIWLMPSRWPEPFGRVSIEAQACERAVLVANSGGLPETVLDSRFVVDGYAVQDWLNAIEVVAAIPPTELRQNAVTIKTEYSQESQDRRLDAIFSHTEVSL